MKKVSKIFALILALTLVAGVFSACGGKKAAKVEGKYTYWASLDYATAQTLTSYSELLMYQEIAKATGMDVEFIHPAQGSTGSEAFQILLSSGDYPDMIEYSWGRYTGGPDQAIDDGVIIGLNDYLKEYAPNYYDYMEGEKGKANDYLYKAQSLSDKGNYYGFKNLCVGTYRGFGGLYIRKDMLDKWGLDVPVTIDDWTNVFKTAKENGVKAPLTGGSSLFSFVGTNLFNGAWKVGKDFYLEGGTVKFGPFEPAYKDYLAKMAEWMKAGYIDRDFVTNDATSIEGYMTNGSSVASVGFVGSAIGKLIPAMEEKEPNYSVVACPSPVLKEGETSNFVMSLTNEANDPCIAISVQCGKDDEQRYIEAVKWCDYLYSDEGLVLKSFGVEGDTYTVEEDENGEKHYVYTDKITKPETIGAHSIEAALYHFFRPANAPGLNQHPDYFEGYYTYDEQKDAIVVWNENTEQAKKHAFPTVSYTADEAGRKAEIEAKGRDNLDAAISNIVLGKAPISDFDKAVKKAKTDGYDELLKINQAAYDRYISVIKKN